MDKKKKKRKKKRGGSGAGGESLGLGFFFVNGKLKEGARGGFNPRFENFRGGPHPPVWGTLDGI